MGRALILMLALTGCTTQPVVTKPRIVTVTKYVQVPVSRTLLDPCAVTEPDPACWRDGRVFCNGQLRSMLDAYRLQLAECRSGIEALIEGQK